VKLITNAASRRTASDRQCRVTVLSTGSMTHGQSLVHFQLSSVRSLVARPAAVVAPRRRRRRLSDTSESSATLHHKLLVRCCRIRIHRLIAGPVLRRNRLSEQQKAQLSMARPILGPPSMRPGPARICTTDLQVAGSISGRWLSRNIGQLRLASLRGR